MIGVEMITTDAASAIEQACYRRGLLVLTCGARTIRLAPPLIVNHQQAGRALELFALACDDVAKGMI
jgi:4-aminobutyrate aminotransferase